MDWKKKVLVGFLIIDGLAINGILGYLIYQFSTSRVTGSQVYQPPPVSETVVAGTDERFVNIDSRIRILEDKIVNVTPVPTGKQTTITVVKPAVVKKSRTVQYVTIPGSGSTQANTWADLSGTEFYFNPEDYPGLVEVYLEVNMKLFNGNGMASVRLFDVTHGIGVQGSDVHTSLQADTVVTSGKVSFWAGKNLVRVQGMSLTADTAVYNSGRLRIVTEN